MWIATRFKNYWNYPQQLFLDELLGWLLPMQVVHHGQLTAVFIREAETCGRCETEFTIQRLRWSWSALLEQGLKFTVHGSLGRSTRWCRSEWNTSEAQSLSITGNLSSYCTRHCVRKASQAEPPYPAHVHPQMSMMPGAMWMAEATVIRVHCMGWRSWKIPHLVNICATSHRHWRAWRSATNSARAWCEWRFQAASKAWHLVRSSTRVWSSWLCLVAFKAWHLVRSSTRVWSRWLCQAAFKIWHLVTTLIRGWNGWPCHVIFKAWHLVGPSTTAWSEWPCPLAFKAWNLGGSLTKAWSEWHCQLAFAA